MSFKFLKFLCHVVITKNSIWDGAAHPPATQAVVRVAVSVSAFWPRFSESRTNLGISHLGNKPGESTGSYIGRIQQEKQRAFTQPAVFIKADNGLYHGISTSSTRFFSVHIHWSDMKWFNSQKMEAPRPLQSDFRHPKPAGYGWLWFASWDGSFIDGFWAGELPAQLQQKTNGGFPQVFVSKSLGYLESSTWILSLCVGVIPSMVGRDTQNREQKLDIFCAINTHVVHETIHLQYVSIISPCQRHGFHRLRGGFPKWGLPQ